MSTRRRLLWPWIAAPAGVLLLAATFVMRTYKMPSGSMEPTIHMGAHLFVNMLARNPKRGDIIVFKYPKDPSKDFIKRVIGIGGDRVEIREGVVYVNESPIPRVLRGPTEYRDADDQGHESVMRADAWEETMDGRTWTTFYNRDEQPRSFVAQTVPPDSYFVLGDNRDNSHDSRYWGAVPQDHVRGTFWRVWYSAAP
jgi:signal peptidase I